MNRHLCVKAYFFIYIIMKFEKPNQRQTQQEQKQKTVQIELSIFYLLVVALYNNIFIHKKKREIKAR